MYLNTYILYTYMPRFPETYLETIYTIKILMNYCINVYNNIHLFSLDLLK